MKNKTTHLIRLARKKDIEQLVDLQVEFEKFFIKIGSSKPYKINRISRKKDIIDLNFAKNHIMRTIVAENDEKRIVGKISFYKGYLAEVPPYYIFRLSGVFVDEKSRGLGLSKMMLGKLFEIAKKENIKSISWSVWGKNKSAVKFYENIGAKYYESEYDEHYMFIDV